jgi:putative methionine-R-sulfoxide reductase with GAF domain
MDANVTGAVVRRLYEQEPTFDWVGVYLVEGDGLVLGPFRGKPTEHTRIPLGGGVCGSVAAKGETEVVPDVRRRPGHIACDIDTRSEVVVPIVREGKVLGVLDVDSNTFNAFGGREVAVVEAAARDIAGLGGTAGGRAEGPEPRAVRRSGGTPSGASEETSSRS